jgi:hypothetical protein
MIKLPKDKYGNEGWVVKARKPHRCEGYRHEYKHIKPGEHYYRTIAWPGSDGNYDGPGPWVLKLCRECVAENNAEMAAEFDAAVTLATEPKEQG